MPDEFFTKQPIMTAALCAAELLILDGADAGTFAHAQFCNDVKTLRVGAWQWNAWLDPQGRVRCIFALMHVQANRLVAWLPLGGAAPIRVALARYVMRSKLEITMAIWTLHALEGPSLATAIAAAQVVAHDGGYLMSQPPGSGRLAWIAPAATGPFDSDALNQWRLADIDAGLPFLAPELDGEFVAQALDLERLCAIRFDKGCYPGQEIAARLHFRGGNKRHLRHVRVHGETPLPGATIVDAERSAVGRILYGAASTGKASNALAVLTNVTEDVLLFSAQGERINLHS